MSGLLAVFKTVAYKSIRRVAVITMLSAALSAPGSIAIAQGGLFGGARPACDVICFGGAQIKVERFEPTGLTTAFCPPRPAVILLHGADGLGQHGPLYREAAAGLAKAGYSAYILHYFDITPGIAARGGVHPSAIQGSNFLAWQAAVSASVEWVACQPGVDPTRVGLIGFSLGSFLAVTEGARNPRVSAVVDFFGGLPPQIAASVRRLAPTLIIHGEADRIVPVTEALRLRDLLASRGVPHDLVIYPGVGHELPRQAQDDAAKRVLQFLRCYL